MIFILVKDLFSRAPILEEAKRLKIETMVETDVYRVRGAVKVLVNLEEFGLEGVEKIVEHNPRAQIIGFGPHVQLSNYTRVSIPNFRVFPRSVFFKQLSSLLSG